jgi:glycosyltransferase involved in cell wall biosynthesis
MRIAQIAPLQVAVPPRGYGGTERVVYALTEALVHLGHEVTLFATGDSHTSARLVSTLERAINFDPEMDSAAYHIGMLEDVYGDAGRFDVIHSHLDYLTLPFARRSATPTVLTLHGDLATLNAQRAYPRYPNANYVSISNAQRASLPSLHYVATIHHGVDVQSFPFVAEPGEYLAFVGRMSPDKRPDVAIEIALRAGIPLKLAAKLDHHEMLYFDEVIRPLLNHPSIEWLGEIDEAAKRDLMAHALALLVPIGWPEPFGMVFIEALACGTPVLTCPTGAAPELLEDGVTGYTSMEPEMLAVAAQNVSRISRRGCRAYAQQRFDTRLMASNYLNVYQQVLGNQHLLLPLAKELSVADYEDASASDAYNTHHPHHTRHSHHH